MEVISAGMEADDDISELAWRVLTDHYATAGRTVCAHPRGDIPQPLQIATIATTVYDPIDGRLWVTPAPPCEQKPQLFELW